MRTIASERSRSPAVRRVPIPGRAVVQVTTPAVGDEQTQDNPHVSR